MGILDEKEEFVKKNLRVGKREGFKALFPIHLAA